MTDAERALLVAVARALAALIEDQTGLDTPGELRRAIEPLERFQNRVLRGGKRPDGTPNA